jgi:hypothetical protein
MPGPSSKSSIPQNIHRRERGERREKIKFLKAKFPIIPKSQYPDFWVWKIDVLVKSQKYPLSLDGRGLG